MDAQDKSTLIMTSVAGLLIFTIAAFLGTSYYLVKQNNTRVLNELAISEQNYTEKMAKCVTDGYTFVVDGIAVEEPTSDFISSGFGRYNISYDDTGKQVIMTTLQPAPKTSNSHTTSPIFFFMP